MFSVDFYILIIRLLPPLKRKPIMIAWLYRLLSPLIRLYGVFTGFRQDIILRSSITSQTLSLEWLLNHLFDPTNEGIYIETTPFNGNNNFVYSESNLAAPDYVYSENDTGSQPFYIYSVLDYFTTTHFTVYVPTGLFYDANTLTAIVDYYRLAGKNWTIQTY